MIYHHKTVKIQFLIIVFLIAAAIVFGIAFAKSNYYLSNRYLELNFNWLKNSLNGFMNGWFSTSDDKSINENSSVLVLSYHGIDAENTVSKDLFEKQMRKLKSDGYKSISFTELKGYLLNNAPVPEKSVLITFQEGRKDSYYNTQPILKALGFNAVIFVDPKHVPENDDSFYLSKVEIKDMANSNWDVELYGDVALDGNYDAAVEKSKIDLSEIVEKEVETASYPFGSFGLEEEVKFTAAAKNSFPLVFSTYWPRNFVADRSNHFDYAKAEAGKSLDVKQIFMNNLPEEEFEKIITLPEVKEGYIENFADSTRWLSTGGTLSVSDGALNIENENRAAFNTFMDKSYYLEDYDFSVKVKSISEGGDPLISLVVRARDPHDYTSCEYSPSSVKIKTVRAGKESIVHSMIKGSVKSVTSGTVLGARAYNGIVQCLFDGNSVAIAELDDSYSKNGSIGLRLRSESSNKNYKVSLSEIKVATPEIPNISVKTDGKEAIYSFINQGSIALAEEVLNNKYTISRFDTVTIDKINWDENYFDDRYWRFNFYNLEPVRNLIYAWQKTGDTKYKDKAIEIIDSFGTNGVNGKYSWDLHGTAFRAMTILNTWKKLSVNGQLTPEMNAKFIALIEKHGKFLADPAHFEEDYNHGLDQAAALYVLGVNMTSLPESTEWRNTASVRLTQVLGGIIDSDGVLVENSPYYHFYVLEKFWEVNQYLNKYGLSVGGDFNANIKKMISYAAYILQPDLHVPVVGASLDRKINLFGMYEEMAAQNPEFMYVLSKGTAGKVPAKKNVEYKDSGETIMRSGWGTSSSYDNETQVVFDVGNYRTNHSDLDALSFSLYGAGRALMPDAGLYTYDPGLFRDYFHGTRAHNTVTIDGVSQEEGSDEKGFGKKVTAGFFQEGDGYVYQSGEASLVKDVSHQRAMALLGKSTLVVVDRLTSATEHDYEQMFHLFPGAQITKDGLNVSVKDESGKVVMTIKQYVTDGVTLKSVIGKDTPPLDGLCSFEYTKAVPCYSLAYGKHAKDASFVTVIDIGSTPSNTVYSSANNTLTIKTTGGKTYDIATVIKEGSKRKVEVINKPTLPEIQGTPLDLSSGKWTSIENYDFSKPLNIVKNGDDSYFKLDTDDSGEILDAVYTDNIDFSDKSLYFEVNTEDVTDLARLDVILSSSTNKNTATFSIKSDTYTKDFAGTWLPISVSKAELRKVVLGNWYFQSPNFDWSHINAIKIRAASKPGESVTVKAKNFKLVSSQQKPVAVLMFDDGWESVLDAAKLMQKYNLKGNTAIIASSVGKRSFMTVDQLKELQNAYGWDIVNHSSLHKNAVEFYAANNNFEGYESDVLDGAQFLQINGLNSAPNWYVYPNGKTNEALKKVIGKYYTFARATIDAPETYPFADPLGVKVFSVYSDRVNSTDVQNAVSDAVKYNHSLFLMFHKFSESDPDLYTEFALDQFDDIMKHISETGIKVVTLSEFDEMNGVNEPTMTFTNAVPDQISLSISKK